MTTAARSPQIQDFATPPVQWWRRVSPTAVGCVVAVAVAIWSTRGA